ncbi:tRNA threonylcarbamoyladenosine biosynthesis protein [Spiroplasma gladiatoris]|uniref:L-threonylcarbamoyladenylate synthase n=1 Tax=Spiroplasma gladiatoris TaxID=2143 RepID=A0A4P7AKU6_9MOLU|nr:Sua5/YciO/YrdC/YwlC family protein [Spiroplasma gladiatoris]QBQ08180.1 tRNA threonylcarbamoyladenosine biosynthesis protein [Spiroplasma gladiatoris]
MLLNKKQINLAVDMLNNNEIIILPTDTIYGLSAIINKKNQNNINKIKKCNEEKPLIILVANFKQAKEFIDLNKDVKKILKCKEPTTVIYKKNTSNLTYAIRLVKRKDLKKIIKKTGPIFSTSVNITGEKFINNKKDLEAFLGIKYCFFTEKSAEKPSKIIDLLGNSIKR